MGHQSLGGIRWGRRRKWLDFFTDIPQGLVKIEQKRLRRDSYRVFFVTVKKKDMREMGEKGGEKL